MSNKATTKIDEYVGQRVRQARERLGLNAKQLAGMINVTPIQLSKYETAKNRLSVSRLHTIAMITCTPIEWFFPDE